MATALQDLPGLLTILFKQVLHIDLLRLVSGESHIELTEYRVFLALLQNIPVQVINQLVTESSVQNRLSNWLTYLEKNLDLHDNIQ